MGSIICSLHLILLRGSNEEGWVHGTCTGEMRNSYKILVGKHQRRHLLRDKEVGKVKFKLP